MKLIQYGINIIFITFSLYNKRKCFFYLQYKNCRQNIKFFTLQLKLKSLLLIAPIVELKQYNKNRNNGIQNNISNSIRIAQHHKTRI